MAAQAWAQAPETLWTRRYSPVNNPSEGHSIRQCYDGGFIIGGIYSDYLEYHDAYLVRTDSNGDSLWTLSIIHGSNGTVFNSLTTSPNNSIVAVGLTDELGMPQAWGAVLSDGGSVIRELTLNSDEYQQINFTWVSNTPDGFFITIGYSSDSISHNTDLRVTKFDSLGDVLWSRTYGGPDIEWSGSAKPDIQGGYIIAGSTFSYGAGASDGYLISADAFGDTIWTRTYGGPARDMFQEVVQAPDSGYVMVGRTSSFGHGGEDIWVVKINSSGDTLWSRTFGDAFGDWGISIDKVLSGGYIVAGNITDINSLAVGAYLIRLNENGDTLWTKVLNPYVQNTIYSIISLGDSGFICTGSIDLLGHTRFWVVRLGPEQVEIEDETPSLPKVTNLVQNYPNPFNPTTTIKYSLSQPGMVNLSIYNILGEKQAVLFEGRKDTGEYQAVWDAKDFPSGLYFVRLKIGNKSQSIKLMLLK